MRKKLMFLPMGLAVALAAGCLQKETTHTLYLSPDGSVRWDAAESGVYSDEKEAGPRIAEEQAYITAALTGAHPVALGLEALEPVTMSTTVIRDQRPFHVVTSASFARADRMLERLFRESGITAIVSLTNDGTRSRLRAEFDFTRGVVDRESPANVLLEELERFTFVLTEGEFVAGGGFEVADRSGRARISGEWFDAADEALKAKRRVELVLAWE